MLTFNWNSAYEATPTSTSNRNSLDDHFRRLKRGIREVMEIEHNWGPYADKDDGSHIPGKTRAVLKDDAATRDTLASVQEGGLYLLDDGSSLTLMLYIDGAWETISVTDHGELINLVSGDGHTQYVRKDNFVMTGDLDMGGNALLLNSDGGGKLLGFTTGVHRSVGHSTIGNVDAYAANIVTPSTLLIHEESETGSGSSWSRSYSNLFSAIPNNYIAHIAIPHYTFFPNFYAYNAASRVQIVTPSTLNTRAVGLASANSFDYRVNYRYIGS